LPGSEQFAMFAMFRDLWRGARVRLALTTAGGTGLLRLMTVKTLCTLGCALGTFVFQLSAADWPQYRGSSHDGISSEKILKSWPQTGLRQVWKVPLTDGFSSFAVTGGKAFTILTREVEGAKHEVCLALDASSGSELWAVPIGVAKYDGGGDSGTPTNRGGDGPRSTPAVAGDRVYTLSSRLVLQCLDAQTGKEAWQHALITEYAGRNITWQSAASPLVEDGLVYVAAGGEGQALLAFDAKDGHLVWKGQDDGITQSTPVAATILGVRQVIFFTQKGLVSTEPKTGEVLWRQSFPFRTSAAISPVVAGDIVYCSAAYGVGASACKINKASSSGTWSATELWFVKGNAQANHWSTPVCVDGYIYGLCGQAAYGKASLKCVEAATGKVSWTHDGFGMGGCLFVDGQIMVLSDAGDLVLVKATPSQFTEVARTHVLDGKCWNVPALSDGRLYARSTKEGVCLDLSPKSAAAARK
jgi:outer membrane protein assembly factor BamB